MPPESCFGYLSSNPSSPTSVTFSATRRARSALRHALELGEQLDVAAHRAPLQQRGVLEHVAEAGAVDGDRAGRRRVEAGGDPQQRRLAAARRPDDGDELAGRDAERRRREGERAVGERLGDVVELEHRRRRGGRPWMRWSVVSVIGVRPQCMIMPPVTLNAWPVQ